LDSAAAARESPASAATAGVAGDSSDMMRSCRGHGLEVKFYCNCVIIIERWDVRGPVDEEVCCW
jgi:hypothetical protein